MATVDELERMKMFSCQIELEVPEALRFKVLGASTMHARNALIVLSMLRLRPNGGRYGLGLTAEELLYH